MVSSRDFTRNFLLCRVSKSGPGKKPEWLNWKPLSPYEHWRNIALENI